MLARQCGRAKRLIDLYDQLMTPATAPIDPSVPINWQPQVLGFNREYELAREQLKLTDRVLGSGQFGKVIYAKLQLDENELEVAVKVPLNGQSPSEQKALLDEMKVMIHVGGHQNVLALIGVVTKHITKG